MRTLVALGLFTVAIVCVPLAAYAFDQVVNPPRCGSQEFIFSCHGDLWYHLMSGVAFVVLGFTACLGGIVIALRPRVVRR